MSRHAAVLLSVAHSSRRMNLATSMTTLECEPAPISLVPSVARTVSICRPSTFVTSASPVTVRPTGVAREMAHVDNRADCALTRVEISPDCIEGGVFHDHDHHGG